MPRGPGFPRAIRETAVDQYLSGRATIPEIAEGLGVNRGTISRWIEKARREGRQPTAPPADIATRVAALAPPPAPPEEPTLGLGDGSTDALITALKRDYLGHLETAKRARAQGDPKAETAARTAAVNTAREIRQLQAAARKEGGDALAITKDEVDAAREAIRMRLDEIAAAKGETLMWTLDGTPNVTPVTRDTPSRATGPA